MNKIDFTFIIPAYNSGHLLRRAVESIPICSQYHIEILIVVNGSTDGTEGIAYDLSQEFPEVRVLHSGKGVSKARNLGIDEANGEWIFFLDADDTMNTERLKSVMTHLSSDVDGDLHFYNFQKDKELVKPIKRVEELDNKESIDSFISRTLIHPTLFLTVWGKAIRRRLIAKTRFDETLRVSEDSKFILELLLNTNKVVLEDESFYQYTINPSSTMNTYDNLKIQGYIDALVLTEELFTNVSSKILFAFDKYKMAQFNLSMVRQVFHKDSPLSYQSKISEIKRLSQFPIYRKVIQKFKLKNINSLGDVPIWLISKKCYYLAALVYSIRAIKNSRKEK